MFTLTIYNRATKKVVAHINTTERMFDLIAALYPVRHYITDYRPDFSTR